MSVKTCGLIESATASNFEISLLPIRVGAATRRLKTAWISAWILLGLGKFVGYDEEIRRFLRFSDVLGRNELATSRFLVPAFAGSNPAAPASHQNSVGDVGLPLSRCALTPTKEPSAGGSQSIETRQPAIGRCAVRNNRCATNGPRKGRYAA